MASATEKMVSNAFSELFGDDHAGGTIAAAPVKRDPQYWKALAVAPDQDDDAFDLLQRYFAHEAEHDEFAGAVGRLMIEHAGDDRYLERCRRAVQSRADLASLEQRELLRDWWPPVRLICLPM